MTGTPYNGEALTYTLKGNAENSGLFAFDTSTGQISVAQGATLDYETDDQHRETETSDGQVIAKFYSGSVHYTVDGRAAVIYVKILLEDIENKPDAPTLTRTRFSEPTNPALDVTWTAPATDGTVITGYKAQYRKQGDTDWTAYTGTLSATSTSINLPDLEAGATYEAQVRAVTGEGDGPWSSIGSGQANHPPTLTGVAFNGGTFSVGSVVDYRETGQGALGVLFQDADSDALTYSASAQHPALLGVSLSGDAGQAHLRVTLLNPGTSNVTYTATDPYGGQVSRSVTLTASPKSVSRSVPEYSPAGTAVGDPVTGAPYNGEALIYTLTGEAAEAFVIASTTGQISVKQGATLDYEAMSSYPGIVNYTVDGHAAVISVNIRVTDVAPKPDAPTLTRTQFDEQSNPALDVTWTAPDASGTTITGYKVQYRKQGATEWTAYSTSTLSATTTSVNLPNLEAGATYEAQALVITSEEGEGPWSDTGSGQANRPPNTTGVSFVKTTLGWNITVAVNSPVTGHFKDSDGDTLTYSATPEYPGILNAWTLFNGPNLIVQTFNPATSRVSYRAHDPYGGVSGDVAATFTVVRNVTLSVPENSPAGTQVGSQRVAGIPYGDEKLTYTLAGDATNAFAISTTTGWILVAEDATLDYETKSSYTGKVEYTIQGQPAVVNLTINVADVAPGKPDAPTLTRTQFSEPTDPALDVTWTAPDANGTTITGYKVQYRKQGATEWTDYSTSTLSATTTSLNLPNLEAGATYEAQVLALSDEGPGPWSDTGSGQANTPPQQTGDYSRLTEGPVGTQSIWRVPTTEFTDADGDALMLFGSADHPALLGVSVSGEPGNNSLTVTLLNPGSSTLTYGVHDGYGGYFSETYTIRAYHKTSRSVNENSPAGTLVGGPVTGTPYNGEALTYTLKGKAADSENFVIATTTGQISVAEGATLDYETDDEHREIEYWNGEVFNKFYRAEVHYTVDGHAAVIHVNILVEDVEPGKPDTPTLTRTRFSEPTDPALDVTWTAPDANGTTITGYQAQYRRQGDTEWTAYTGTLSATTTSLNLPNLEAGATYEAQVRAVTSEEDEGPWSDTGSGQTNTPPNASAVSLGDATVNWNDPANYDISDKFQDADGDTLTYSASSEYPGALTAAITGGDSDILRVTVLNPASSTVTYSASDPYGGHFSRTVTITGEANETRSIAENSPAGTAVGDPVTGAPYDGETLTYTLTGEAANAFVINSATGQISVKQGATLDYETKSSYTGKVEYTVQGRAAAISLTINLASEFTVAIGLPETFKNLRPMKVTFTFGKAVTGFEASDIIVENGTLGSLSGSGAAYRSAVTPNGDGDVTVTVVANSVTTAGGSERPRTAVSAVSRYLWVTLEGPSGPRLSWDPFEVVATFSEPPGDDIEFEHWNVEDDVPVSIEGTTATFTLTPEYYGSRWGTWSYRSRIWVTWRGVKKYFEVYSDADRPRVHRIVGPTETQRGPFSIDIQLTEDAVNFSAEDLTVVNGDVAALTHIRQWKYRADIAPTRSGRLTVDIAAGVFQDTVGWDNTAARQYSVNIDLSPDAPDAPSVAQSADDPMGALDIAWTEPDTPDAFPITDYDVRYRQAGGSAWLSHPFTGTTTSTLISNLSIGTTYEVQVRARNSQGAGAWSQTGEGATASENNRPEFLKLTSARSVPENSPAGTLVGDPVTATDLEGHPLTYTLKTPSSIFALDASTGQVSVKQGASLDHEAQPNTYTLVVEASDGLSVIGIDDGHIVDAETTVTITVTDVNEPPPAPDAPSVTRSASASTSTLDVAWTAPDTTGRPPITSYVISYRKKGESEAREQSLNSPRLTTSITGLEAGTIYQVSIQALNDEGASPWSDFGEGATSGSDSSAPAPTQPNPQPASPRPAPEPTPTPTPETTPTPTPEATPEPTPETTPTATSTPEATPTPTPETTPEPTPETTPTASSTPEVTLTPAPRRRRRRGDNDVDTRVGDNASADTWA